VSENLDLACSIYADWERGDFSHGECADLDMEWVLVEGPSPGPGHGLAGMVEGLRSWFSSSHDVHVYADEFRELDDERVAVLVHSTGHGKASGLQYTPELTRTAHLFQHGVPGAAARVWTIREGKVVQLVGYADPAEALEAVGLEE
jgi:ketosteroid isomerase-like protein